MIQIELTNPSCIVKRISTYVYDMQLSGTDVHVFEDDTELTYSSSGTVPGTYTVTVSGTNITVGNIGNINNYCIINPHQIILNGATSIKVLIRIIGKTSTGVYFNKLRQQNIVVIDSLTSAISDTAQVIVWKGELVTAPNNPVNGWMYRDTTVHATYGYFDGWQLFSQDGAYVVERGIVWKGELSTAPESPVTNWVYKNSDNKVIYIYTGSEWSLFLPDIRGVDGINGINATITQTYIIYHSNPHNMPPIKPTTDGNLEGWTLHPNIDTVWMCIKNSSDIAFGIWEDPILIRGQDGLNGVAATNGIRGAGWYTGAVDYVVTAANIETAATEIMNAMNLIPVVEDTLTITNKENTILVEFTGTIWQISNKRYLSGEMLVKGSTWVYGHIKSAYYQWNNGNPKGFSLNSLKVTYLGSLTEAPIAPVEGDAYHNLTDNKCYYYTDTWIDAESVHLNEQEYKYNIIGGTVYGTSFTAGTLQSANWDGSNGMHIDLNEGCIFIG